MPHAARAPSTRAQTAGIAADPTSGARHVRADIQGLRAVAVLLVMTYHAGLPMSGGFIGVDVFFVVSGFVITGLLLRELNASGRVALGRFYARRVRRLLPALALVTSVTAILAWALLPLESQSATGRTGVAASVFLANVEIMRSTGGYFDAAAEANPLLHTWSLSVEEQFYLVFPTLLLLAWVLRRRGGIARFAPATAVTVVLVASFCASLALSNGWGMPDGDAAQELAFYSSFARGWQFAAGSLIAIAWRVIASARARVPSWIVSSAALLGAGVLAVAAFTIDGEGYPGAAAIAPTAATVLLLVTTDADRGLVGRVLTWRPVVAVGDLSYSLYLWHWPVLLLASTLVPDPRVRTSALIVLASAVPAYASYRWVEGPLRRSGSLRPRSVLRLAGACIVVPATLGAMLAIGADRAWWQPEIASWEETRLEKPTGREAGCHADQTSQPTLSDECIFGDGSQGVVLLVGDSHAAALGDSLLAAVDPLGYRVAVLTTNGCPFLVDASRWHTWDRSGAIAPCVGGNAAQWAAVDTLDPVAVVIANASTKHVRNSPAYPDDATATSRWGAAVKDTLEEVANHGAPAILVHEVPEHPKSLATCTHSWGVDQGCVNTARPFSEDRRSPIVAAERIAADAAGALVWDPAGALCDDTTCRREHNGDPIYLDESHVNPSARQVLSGPLREVLMPLLEGSPGRPTSP